jgi:two-component system response regulator NreC
VARGETFFSPSIAQQAEVIGSTTSQRPAAAGADELLTGREREILQLVAEGHSNQWIARELVISVKTVETHRGTIRNKLGARSRADLIRYALRKGLVGLEPEPDVREQELPLAA